ncbi:MAG TPA: hypothetical protein VN716_13410, partial [Vicinamibacterales bacterium]|nr:hypothetical protein [Vicinamibacterales bacterium]
SLTNAAREIALYAAGGEAAVVRWTGTALVVQVLSAAMLIPILGSTGAAIAVFVGEAAVWLPLRRAASGRDPGKASRLVETQARA